MYYLTKEHAITTLYTCSCYYKFWCLDNGPIPITKVEITDILMCVNSKSFCFYSWWYLVYFANGWYKWRRL